ncbi:MAG: 5-(carboxyamino)imidazole ribonucleotide synthase [Arenicella sp.]|jgi:5-(carboxyamino)imidazole ribonucleotide synthase
MSTPNSKANPLPMIGILGDGQLAMMMTQAYQAMGGKTVVFAEHPDGPASQVADKLIIGSSSHIEDLIKFFNEVDIVTLENEFIDSKMLIDASAYSNTEVAPNPARYQLIEDKLSENLFFEGLGINIAKFFEAKSTDDLIDEPGYLKLAKGGYDGIGTYRVDNKKAATDVFEKIKGSGTVLFEHSINFKKELSLIAVANSSEIIFYPLFETHQEDGTCRFVNYPSGVSAEVERDAQDQVRKIMQTLETRGLFAFEFFLDDKDQLILNESAPRPHNSGHITLDLTDCSQFENHMRAVADLPLIKPTVKHPSMLMVNLLGTRNGPFEEDLVLNQTIDKNLSFTFYKKRQSRIKRKMGHVNLWGAEQKERAEHLIKTLEI